MDQQLKDKVLKIFVNYLEKDINKLNVDSTFSENNLTELDVIESVMRVEDEFKIEISDDEADKLNSIANLIFCVENKLAN